MTMAFAARFNGLCVQDIIRGTTVACALCCFVKTHYVMCAVTVHDDHKIICIDIVIVSAFIKAQTMYLVVFKDILFEK